MGKSDFDGWGIELFFGEIQERPNILGRSPRSEKQGLRVRAFCHFDMMERERPAATIPS
jgi:hypothetical protein